MNQQAASDRVDFVKTPAAPARNEIVLLAGLALLPGAALRLPALFGRELWLDELFSYAFAITPRWELFRPSTTLPHTPLFFFIASFIPTSAPDWVFRLPALFFNLLFIVLVTIMVRRRHGREESVIVGLILATHPLLVYWSGELRMYTLYGLLLSTTIVAIATRSLRGRWWGPLFAASFFTFPYALYHLPWFLVVAAWRRDREALLSMAVWMAPVIAWLGPALLHLHGMIGHENFDYLTFHTLLVFLKTTFAGNYLTGSVPAAALWMALGSGLIGLVAILRAPWRRRHEWPLSVFAAASGAILIYWLVQQVSGQGFTYRSFFAVSQLLILLGAVGLASIPIRPLRWALVAAVLIAHGLVLAHYHDLDCPYNFNTPRAIRIDRLAGKVLPTLKEDDALYMRHLVPAMAALRYFPPHRARMHLDPDHYDQQIMAMERGFFAALFERHGIRIARPAIEPRTSASPARLVLIEPMHLEIPEYPDWRRTFVLEEAGYRAVIYE